MPTRGPGLGACPPSGRRRGGRGKAAGPVDERKAATWAGGRSFANARRQLLPGMSAQAEVAVQSEAERVLAARDALVRRPDGAYGVWVVTQRDGELRVSVRRVQTGRTVGGDVEIREGLSPGDRVVVRGNEGLSDGQAVRIVDRIGQSKP